jgi:hypothetical protein
MEIPKLYNCQFHLQVVDYNVSIGAVLQHPLYTEGLLYKRTTSESINFQAILGMRRCLPVLVHCVSKLQFQKRPFKNWLLCHCQITATL